MPSTTAMIEIEHRTVRFALRRVQATSHAARKIPGIVRATPGSVSFKGRREDAFNVGERTHIQAGQIDSTNLHSWNGSYPSRSRVARNSATPTRQGQIEMAEVAKRQPPLAGLGAEPAAVAFEAALQDAVRHCHSILVSKTLRARSPIQPSRKDAKAHADLEK